MKSTNVTYRKLFLSTFILSAFTFGGGYVIITLMKKKFVNEFKWLEEDEMLEYIAIAQSAPGAIAVNGSIVIGYELKGILGILTCVLATILPPFLIISVVSMFYVAFKSNPYVNTMLEGMQAGVAALICMVVFEMMVGLYEDKKWVSMIVVFVCFILQYFLQVHIAVLLGVFILIGTIKAIRCKKEEQV